MSAQLQSRPAFQSLPKTGDTPDPLSHQLLDRVLAKLKVDREKPSLEGLRRLYSAWSHSHAVPFDNVRKLIHVSSGDSAPLPGSTAEDYLEAWLKHSTGGTCWAGANAMHAVVSALGYTAFRCIATMMAAPNIPPNHGTVAVLFEEGLFLVDSGMICNEPLLLDADIPTSIEHPAWGVQCSPREGRFHISWRPLLRLDGLVCRIESIGATGDDYRKNYEKTRDWSPFNYELTTRLNSGDQVIGCFQGKKATLAADGSVLTHLMSPEDRKQLLVESIGMSEEIVSQLPEDRPTPPPPGSATALAQMEKQNA
jgi:N-hydroxyarylamine O-acetyltransferase